MSGAAKDVRKPHAESAPKTGEASPRFVPLANLRRLSKCGQVAAVCFRIRNHEIEFLLIRTSGGGKWTFPKGSAEPGLTHAQAAALEAFEEAGVHGRIEEAAFARYFRVPPPDKCGKKQRHGKGAVNAHLCEVVRLSAVRESYRKRTWFPADEAAQCLREGREAKEAAEIVQIVHQAVQRIQRMGDGNMAGEPGIRYRRESLERELLHNDGLRKVKFDFFEAYGWMTPQPALGSGQAMHRPARAREAGSLRETVACEILEFEPPKRPKLPN